MCVYIYAHTHSNHTYEYVRSPVASAISSEIIRNAMAEIKRNEKKQQGGRRIFRIRKLRARDLKGRATCRRESSSRANSPLAKISIRRCITTF